MKWRFVQETKWDNATKSRIPDENSNAYHIEAYDPKTNEAPPEIQFGVARITHASAGFSGDYQPAMNDLEMGKPLNQSDKYFSKAAVSSKYQLFFEIPSDSEEANAMRDLQNSFVEFVVEQAKKQKSNEEVVFSLPKTLVSLFSTPEAVMDFDNFFDSFKINEEKGVISFKVKHSTSRKARPKETNTFNFADQPGMENWKKDASSYFNQLKSEKKVHWPLNISAFTEEVSSPPGSESEGESKKKKVLSSELVDDSDSEDDIDDDDRPPAKKRKTTSKKLVNLPTSGTSECNKQYTLNDKFLRSMGANGNVWASVTFPNNGFSHIKGQGEYFLFLFIKIITSTSNGFNTVAMGYVNVKLPPPIVTCLGQGEKVRNSFSIKFLFNLTILFSR